MPIGDQLMKDVCGLYANVTLDHNLTRWRVTNVTMRSRIPLPYRKPAPLSCACAVFPLKFVLSFSVKTFLELARSLHNGDLLQKPRKAHYAVGPARDS